LRELNTSKSKSLFDILSECSFQVDVLKLTASNLFDACLEMVFILKLNESNPQYIRFFLDEVLSFYKAIPQILVCL